MPLDDEPTGRDLRTIWRTMAVVGMVVIAIGGGAIAAIVREVQQDARIDALAKWQAAKDAEAAAEARMERWRRNRESGGTSPGIRP